MYKDFIDYCRKEIPVWCRYLRKGLNPLIKDYIKSFAFRISKSGDKLKQKCSIYTGDDV